MAQGRGEIDLHSFQDPEDFQRLRMALEAAGFTQTEVMKAVSINDFLPVREGDVPILFYRTRKGTPINTFIRLFLMETPTPLEAVEQAIHPMKAEILAETGLVRIERDRVISNFRLLPFENLFFVYDLPRRLQAKNYVMGIGQSSLTLANITVRRHSRLTLDLGTGCGIQALLASRHSDRVLAVDLNPHAIQLAAFNAKLSGLGNVECIEGNFFEPVRGNKFDLVISNPPFVVSPEMHYIYRDSGMEGDRICQKIVQEVPELLEEGGYCQLLCNWIEKSDQDWRERLAQWFEGAGCDVWAMRSETRDAETYATTWIRQTEKDSPEEFAKRLEEWMSYYQELRIERMSAGLISMRRLSKPKNWYRADEAPEKMLGPCGDYIVRGFALRDFLESVQNDSMLLDTCLVVSPDVRLHQQLEPSSGKWCETLSQIRLIQGLVYVGDTDALISNVLIGCDGNRKLRDLLTDMSASLGVDAATIASSLCNVVRHLIEQGFLLPRHLV